MIGGDKLKKAINLLLTLIVLLGFPLTASAETEAVIYGDTLSCNSGDTVSFSVNIKGNPGIAGFLVSVYTDDDWLYFDENVAQGNFSDVGTISTSYEPQRINVLWFNADNMNGDGTLFSLDVHVSASTPDGEYPIHVSVSEKNTLNDEYEAVSFEAHDGYIMVEHKDRTPDELNEIARQNIQDAQKNYNNGAAVWFAVGVVVAVSSALIIIKIRKEKK